MLEDQYTILLSHLLDDDLDEEQGQQLLTYLEQNPDKLREIARHLELWELYSQTICTQRGAERFADSWQTRLAAAEDADRFVRDVELKLEQDTQPNADRIQEIEQKAKHALDKYLAEQAPTRPSWQSSRRSEWNIGERAREGLERFCDMLCLGLKVVKVLAVCIAVALAIPTAIRYVQAQRVVATLQDTVDARWVSTPKQAQLRRGWLELQEGFAELAFKSGAIAILQAPCRLCLESPRKLFLESGVLALRVSDPKQDFLVSTPNATVKDLGTEFGVVVREDGQTETQVYEGKVQLRRSSHKRANAPSRTLKQGQAAGVDTAGQLVSKDFDGRRFTRVLPGATPFGIPGKRMDLSDILVGGSGFGTGDPNQMVEINTGRVSDIHYDSANWGLRGEGGFVTHTLPCVDYLFIPDAGVGPVQVSSQGHLFGTCPDTEGTTFHYVSNRGMLRHIPGVVATQVLNGREYGTLSHPVISMHANVGITFDLWAIRTMLSGAQFKRFTALCGLSETAGIAVLRESGRAALHHADFWVLVDGEERFKRQGLQIQSGGVPVRLELNDQDRFLTLVVTDGGDGNGFDWGAFADPALELE